MPMYKLRCANKACPVDIFEHTCKIREKEAIRCECGDKPVTVAGRAQTHLKGGGWAHDGYRSQD